MPGEVTEAAPDADGSPRRARRRWTVAVRIVLASVAAATLAGWGSAWWWVFDLVANFRFHLLAATFALAVATLALRRWGEAAVAGGLAVVHLVAVAPLFVGAGSVADLPGRPRIVIEHLNTHAQIPVERLRRYLATTDADVVLLLHLPEEQAAALGPAPGRFRSVAYDPGIHGVDGVLGLARSPRAVGRRVALAGRAGVAITVPVGDGRVTVLGAHPGSPMSAGRAASRDAVLRAMAAFARSSPDPVVLVGDMNATRWSHAFRGLLRTGRLVDSATGRGWGPTYPTWLGPLGLPIDQAVHSRDLVTLARSLRSGLGSPHDMLRVTVGPAQPGRSARSSRGEASATTSDGVS